MQTTYPEALVDFGRTAEAAVERAGGFDLARRAETDAATDSEVRALLERIGLFDIDPRAELDQAVAAAELARVAGSYAVPYPVVPSLLRSGSTGKLFTLIDLRFPLLDHARHAHVWTAATVDGALFNARPRADAGSNLAPFVASADLEPVPGTAALRDRQLALVLKSFLLLGVGQRALETARRHTSEREQFGRPLSDFQVIRHSLANISVDLEGLDLLARYALWSTFEETPTLTDALAARTEAQRVLKETLRLAQQFHGASGLANEYDISVLVRHAQPPLRIPDDTTRTLALLRNSVETDGFNGSFAPTRSAQA